MKENIKKFLIGLIVPVIFVILWVIASNRIENPIVMPYISKVMENFGHAFDNFIGLGSIPKNIAVSLIRVLSGYIVGVVIALPLGVLMGYRKTINQLFSNFINVFRPVPPIAWVPLVLAWFGVASVSTVLGIQGGNLQAYLNNFKFSMMFIIALGTFFPVITNTIFAVSSVPKTLVESAKVLGAKENHIFFKILLPAAAPTIINGLRTGLGTAWACLVAAEMLPGSLSGVGYLITHAYELGRTDLVVTGMICIGAIGALLDGIFRFVEHKYFSWQGKGK
ncbi:NitT/TauT family transport system permease protein [Hathewaya proteolytica DSM 3090]|uniref:NitT/TauT family transport system permease protein n=1 Tax=Hathewaya proteolytica DSM 3090 TaxID=1121331 RepID=A0A1M6PU91_9CLOT|nr:ABC transporter permease [Hathewaya proteolytica]SHK11554.1 NitT/TauT family transport system permease protein [Hathewaya proteolytica DSM 3090]